MRIKQYIKSSMGDSELTAAKIAEATGFSRRYLNNLLSEENNSLMRYLTEQRLEMCRRCLASAFYTQLSVTEIAMRYGFSNTAHFSRCFKHDTVYHRVIIGKPVNFTDSVGGNDK